MRVLHFHNGKNGGVLTYIRNIVNLIRSSEIEFDLIDIVHYDEKPFTDINSFTNLNNYKCFVWNKSGNLYYTFKKLNTIIDAKYDLIFAHDWFELSFISSVAINSQVIFVMHGDYDYYYHLLQKYSEYIDYVICVNKKIKTQIDLKYPKYITKSFYFRHIISNDYIKNSLPRNTFTLLFYCADLKDANKNLNYIIKIDRYFQNIGIKIHWNIAGGGYSKDELFEFWNPQAPERIKFYGFVNREELKIILSDSHILILPSILEGYPFSIVESMLSGLVPIVNNWSSAIHDLINHGENGFLIEDNKFDYYIKYIQILINDVITYQALSSNAYKTANLLFDTSINVQKMLDFFQTISKPEYLNLKKVIKVGSRLDSKYVPNIFTYFIRVLKKII